MATRNRTHYYTPVYIPKATSAKTKRLRLIRRSVLAALSVLIFAVTLIVWHPARGSSDSVVEVSAARQLLREVQSYPRTVDSGNPLPRDYVPANLVSLNTVPNGESVYLRADTAESFLAMLNAMAQDGMAIVPVSGYVSYEEQSAVLAAHTDRFIAEGKTADEAEELALTQYSAPGESEAQLGTQIEIATDLDSMEQFSATDQYIWVCENAYQYGFVIRRSSQPWRLRYVGVDTAQTMRKAGLALDDYISEVRAENPSAVQDAY